MNRPGDLALHRAIRERRLFGDRQSRVESSGLAHPEFQLFTEDALFTLEHRPLPSFLRRLLQRATKLGREPQQFGVAPGFAAKLDLEGTSRRNLVAHEAQVEKAERMAIETMSKPERRIEPIQRHRHPSHDEEPAVTAPLVESREMQIDERHKRREKERHPKPAFRLGDEGRPDHSPQSYLLAPERRYSSGAPLEFLAVGHVTIDTIEGHRRVGGAAVYAALTARRLGLTSGIITSAGTDFPFWDTLSGIETHSITAKATTTFDNDYAGGTRRQRVRALAAPIRAHHLRGIHLAADAAVLYCPVVHEIEAPLLRLTPHGICGVAPQGFFRQWDDTGTVSIREWDDASTALSQADFVCMSEEDAFVPEELGARFAGRAFVITRAERGCRVYAGADICDFPAVPAEPIVPVDPTGAGDVFAAAFLVALRNASPLPHATAFAAEAAAKAVASEGVSWLL